MEDKAIRNILISYLQATNDRIRIYQEKSIGNAICDVMAVTDLLTGYEIKSDRDNYERLDRQVAAYNRFFDSAFLVVSDKHRASAEHHIPAHWGIILVKETGVTVIRAAKKNSVVSRRTQLSVLWQLEMKNLLVKHALPLFAQKSKAYIADRLMEMIPADQLGRDIATELMNRDYSVWNAKDPTVTAGRANGIPAVELVDTLSERDLSEFTLDQWIDLYRKAKEARAAKETAYQSVPVVRTPHAIPYTDIQVSLGAPWISKHIISEFIREVFHLNPSDHEVCYEPLTGNWEITYKNGAWSASVTERYGLKRYNSLYILEATLNLREIKLYDYGVYNEADTIAALEKQKLIIQAFQNWVWEDEDRRWEIEDAYNKQFGQYETKRCDGSALAFPEMSPAYRLFPYQLDAVQTILDQPNTLLAFDVGTGKTFTMIAAAMKMRQAGMSRKNLFVVPNHIVGQWEKMFTELYPKAKVLAIEPKSFLPGIRHKVLCQIRNGDYDGIIMAYSCFEMIPLSAKTVFANMDRQLWRINEALQEYKRKNTWSTERKYLEREKQYFEKLTTDFLQSMDPLRGSDITFEDLGITTLFVDEAHNYKNLPIRTKLKNLNGINTKGSEKCLDLLHKIRCVQNANQGHGVVFATGTPLCNSIADVYAIQIYLQMNELEQTHLDTFDNWVKTFAAPEQVVEIDVNASKYRMVRRFARFFNLPELSRMFSQIAVFHSAEEDALLPELDGYSDVVIPSSDELSGYMKKLCDRTEAIRSQEVHPSRDNMLKVSTDGRKAALDLTLVGEIQPEEFSKITFCVRNVMDIYRAEPEATQLIFCDYSTPKGEKYNVYQELKRRLCAEGVPAKEIAFIHSFGTESRKLELFRQFNQGEIRILLGSTFKLGIGANVQTKLKAIHHLDVPWRPADMVQREGRILRRGNENETVRIFRYITEGSFDSYSWQTLERKQRFISQFLSGSACQRTESDLENSVLSYAEVKALALSEPQMKELAEKENELKRLRILSVQKRAADAQLRQELETLEKEILALEDRIRHTEENSRYLASVDQKAFKAAYDSIAECLPFDVVMGETAPDNEINVLGFAVRLPDTQKEKKPYVLLERLGERYPVPMGETAPGNARRIINRLKKFDALADELSKAKHENEARQKEIQAHLAETSNPYEAQMRHCEAEISQLHNLLQMAG